MYNINPHSCVLWLLVCICSYILPTNIHAEDMVANRETSFQLASLYIGYLYPIPVGDQWKIIDIEGNRVGDTLFDEYVHPFDESLRYAFVSKGGKWYRIVSTGRTVPLDIPVGYGVIFDLGKGLVILQKKESKDPNSKIVFNIVTDQFTGEHFFETVPLRQGDNLLPIRTWTGEIENLEILNHIEIWRDSVHSLLDLVTGERVFIKNEKESFVIWVSEGIFNISMSDSPDSFYTRLMSRYGENIPIHTDKRLDIAPFKNGVALSSDFNDSASGFVLIDRSGRILTQEHKMIANNSSGLSRVVPGDGVIVKTGVDFIGFINTLGNEIIPAQYIFASDFLNGMALVRKNEDMGVYLINSFGDKLYRLQGLDSYDWGFLDWLWRRGLFRRIGDSRAQLINIDGVIIYETSDTQTILRMNRYPMARSRF